jgi:formylglycine-generating enzyme required for sulfatase activity
MEIQTVTTQFRIMKLPLAFVMILCLAVAASAEEPAKPDVKVIENSIGMKLVLVPAGEFQMGRAETREELRKIFPQYGKERTGADRLELADELPQHKVRITRAFYLGQHEVTVGQFRRFVDSGYRPESIADGTGGYGYDPNRKVLPNEGEVFAGRDPKYSWMNPGFKQGEDHPVTNVTWNDAVTMCQWLTEKEGAKYRLPTEAEWEYACRAGTETLYHNGNDVEALIKVGNLYDADTVKNWPQWKEFALKGHDGYEFTSPVGKFAPNAFGLYDMHGNVWEWCNDYHDDNYYAKSPVDDPQGPAEGSVRVRRGGSWHTWPLYVRSSYRYTNTARTRYTLLGMRLVREE